MISNFIVQSLRGDPITIYGTGGQTRSFCYVDDLVEAFVRFMDVETDASPVNLGNPNETTIGELARTIKDMCKSAAPIIQEPLPVDDPTRRCPNIGRARALLAGWEPRVPLQLGLERTIADFRTRHAG